jgi:hypothetical protein
VGSWEKRRKLEGSAAVATDDEEERKLIFEHFHSSPSLEIFGTLFLLCLSSGCASLPLCGLCLHFARANEFSDSRKPISVVISRYQAYYFEGSRVSRI